MKKSILQNLSVTLWLSACTLAIFLFLYVNATYFSGVAETREVTGWFGIIARGVSVAALFGLITDGLILVTTRFLPKKLPYKLKLRKVLKQNLA